MNHQYRILLVEDEPLIQFVIVDILTEIGFEVSNVISTAAEALKEIERGRFDAAIVDCTLADGTCDPVASTLAEQKVPFIIVSGREPDEIAARFPGIRFVSKPFMVADLENAVQALIPNMA